LLTDFSFTLPQARGALAHAAAGGNAYLLSVGPVPGAPAVHGTELYGIVGQTHPGASAVQIARDTFVRDALLTLAEGNTGGLWPPVSARPTTQGIGDRPTDATAHAVDVIRLFEGIERP
jgi:para-nitrobenzyl esterase